MVIPSAVITKTMGNLHHCLRILDRPDVIGDFNAV
jgi:hypothetical protein